jgi:chromosome segregation ATPase
LNIQTIVKSLRGQANTAEQLRQTLDQIDIEGLEAAAEKLEAERRGVLLDGSDKDVEAVEAKIATANRDIERAYAAKAELTKRLDEAAAAATEAELLDRYNTAKAKADAAAKLLRKEYPELGRRFADPTRAFVGRSEARCRPLADQDQGVTASWSFRALAGQAGRPFPRHGP